jgi:hypothetical protein
VAFIEWAVEGPDFEDGFAPDVHVARDKLAPHLHYIHSSNAPFLSPTDLLKMHAARHTHPR